MQVPKNWLKPGAKILLDLGTVKDIAQVSLNGKPAEILWKPPYRADITGTVKAGSNLLEIKVTNEWTNRLIGDRSAPQEKRILSPAPGGMGSFGGPQSLSDAGLIGPVTIFSR